MGIWLFAFLTTFCGLAHSTQFQIYKCPLSSSASILSSSSNKDCSSSFRRDVYTPYGLTHTYLEMDGICYDWGNWNYPRHQSCSDRALACCVQTRTLVYRGTTSCANQIGYFENYWNNQNKGYSVFSWNCQRYDPKLKSVFSDICLKAQKSNTYTSGCSILKKEIVTKHAQNEEYRDAVEAVKQKFNMDLARQAAVSKSESAVIAALNSTYFAAKYNLASSIIPEVNQLILSLGVQPLADLKVDAHTSYGHSTSIAHFQAAIESVVEDDMIKKIASD